jgi:hypothetical protein
MKSCRPHCGSRLGWDARHDHMAKEIMTEFNLILPRDRELIRQLAFVRVRLGPLDWKE